MRCLLLLLTLFWVVHSFGQFKIDYERCKTELYCLLSPEIAGQSPNVDYIVPTTSPNFDRVPLKYSIIIKPLTPKKWLLVLHYEDKAAVDEGIFLFINRAGEVNKPPKLDGLIAGCNKDGALKGTDKAPKNFTFDVWRDDSTFELDKKMICVGILSNTEDIAIQLDKLTTGNAFFGLKMMTNVILGGDAVIGSENKKLVKKSDNLPVENLDFSAVNKFMQCDFELLKPTPEDLLLHTHYLKKVDTLSTTIDCTNYLVEDPSGTYDLLINSTGGEEMLKVERIVCKDNKLYYQISKDYPIEVDTPVVCGKRPTCVPIRSVCDEPDCKKPTGCDSADNCKKLECLDNRWLINDNVEYIGTVECRKESIEDESSGAWHTIEKLEMKSTRIEKGSCFIPKKEETLECQKENPIETNCDDMDEDCFPATISEIEIYCAINHDFKYKERSDGEEYFINEITCDTKTGIWKFNKASDSDPEVKIVFCRFNADKDFALLGGKAHILGLDPRAWYFFIFEYWYFTLAPTPVIITFNIVMYCIFRWQRKKRMKLHQQYLAKVHEKKMDRSQKSWTVEERWKLRPYNPRGKDWRRGRTKVCYDDLTALDPVKALNWGMIKTFSLYSNEEKYMFLERIINSFSKKQWTVLTTIALLPHVLANYDHLDNLKQPLHPKTVYVAFKILKMLVSVYTKRGLKKTGARIRKAIGIRAASILFPMGLERAVGETRETTRIRNCAMEAALFANHKAIEDRLVQIWREKKFNVSSPLRKFVWAMAVKRDSRANDMFLRMHAETVEMIEKWDIKEADPIEELWGDPIEHFIYAICADLDRKPVEVLINLILREAAYGPKHVQNAFHAIMEVFDHQHQLAKLLFRDRHDLIKKKMPIDGAHYREIFRLMFTYCGYEKSIVTYEKQHSWLKAYVERSKNFTTHEQMELLSPHVKDYLRIYQKVHKFKKVGRLVWKQLSAKDMKMYKEDDRNKPDFRKKYLVNKGKCHNTRSFVDPKKRKKKPDGTKTAIERVDKKKAIEKLEEKTAIDETSERTKGLKTAIEMPNEKTAIDESSKKEKPTQVLKSASKRSAVGKAQPRT